MPEETKKKTLTGLEKLGKIQSQIDEVVTAKPEAIPSSELPKDIPLPKQGPEMDTSFATKLARAVSIFAAGAENPEMGMQLLKNFQAQDQAARDQVQQRFSNAMALQGRKFQAQQFGEKVRSTKEREKDIDTENQISALNASLRAVEAELRTLEAAGGGDTPDAQSLNLQRNIMNDMLKRAAENQGIGKPLTEAQKTKDLGPAGIFQAALTELGMSPEELTKAGASKDGFASIREEIIKKRTFDASQRKIKMTPELEVQRAILATTAPILLPSFDLAVEAAPDPNTGDPGDHVAFANALRSLAELSPEQMDIQVDALANKWGPNGEGMFATTDEAEVFIANYVSEYVTLDDLPEGINAEPGLVESLLPNIVDPLGEKRKRDTKKKLRLKELKGKIGSKEKAQFDELKKKKLGTFKEKPKVLFGVKQ